MYVCMSSSILYIICHLMHDSIVLYIELLQLLGRYVSMKFNFNS